MYTVIKEKTRIDFT